MVRCINRDSTIKLELFRRWELKAKIWDFSSTKCPHVCSLKPQTLLWKQEQSVNYKWVTFKSSRLNISQMILWVSVTVLFCLVHVLVPFVMMSSQGKVQEPIQELLLYSYYISLIYDHLTIVISLETDRQTDNQDRQTIWHKMWRNNIMNCCFISFKLHCAHYCLS